ncbi:hypothetical protein D3C71_138310 [compost metagenome]
MNTLFSSLYNSALVSGFLMDLIFFPLKSVKGSEEIFLKENEEKLEIKINTFIKDIECKIYKWN